MTNRTVFRRLVPALLAALSLTLYLLTLTGVHTFDSLSYIRDANGRTGFFFHPHHLLYTPTGWSFWQLWRALGYRGDAALPLEVLNALAGCGCGFVLYRLVWQITNNGWAAVAAAGVLLFNYGAWYYSVETEVYLLALVWLVIGLALMIQLVTQPRRWTAPALGLVLGLAALYHQTNGLLSLVVVVAVALAPLTSAQKLRSLVRAGALAAVVVALGYGFATVDFYHLRTPQAIRDWLFFFIETGWWGKAERGRWIDLGAGLGNSISTQGAWPFWAGIVALLLLGLPSALRRWPRISAVALSWVIIYGAFFFWWEGANIEFWIGALLPLWFLLGLSIASLHPPALHRSGAAVAVLGVAFLGWHNWGIIRERTNPAFDLQRQFSAGIKAHSAKDDLILTPGGSMELYLPYYEDRHNVQTLTQMMLTTHGDGAAALGLVRSEIERALQAGYGVIVDEGMLQLPPDLARRFQLPQAQLDGFWQAYRAALQPVVQDKGTTYFWRLPSANEQLAGQGWTWQSFDWGWQTVNTTTVAYPAGMCFDPQSDPNLVSPVINLDASSYQAVAVTMQTKLLHQTGQLFYAGTAGAIDDAHSFQWPLKSDGQAHTYIIKLTPAQGWQGIVTRLRLDPVTAGDGTPATRTCVSQLRLLP